MGWHGTEGKTWGREGEAQSRDVRCRATAADLIGGGRERYVEEDQNLSRRGAGGRGVGAGRPLGGWMMRSSGKSVKKLCSSLESTKSQIRFKLIPLSRELRNQVFMDALFVLTARARLPARAVGRAASTAAGDAFRVRVMRNPTAAPPAEEYGERRRGVISAAAHARARARITRWPEFNKTPTVPLPAIAEALGVASVHAKLEGSRCGLGSFKALGGGLAVDVLADQHSDKNDGEELTVTTASAGNHGLAVAWGARRRGIRCVIFVHEHVGDAICARMEGFGAEVRRVAGDYDDSVEACKRTAQEEGASWHVLQDVSWEGYTEAPKTIWQGYSTVASEMVEDLSGRLPTHVFVNAGVGGFAASVCGWFWDTHGADRPRFVCVEPDEAACLMESGKRGKASAVEGRGHTIQTGLNCAAAAPLAWEVLERGVDDFVSIGDECVGPCLRLLSETKVGDDHNGIIGGASGVAGLGVLLAAAEDASLAGRLELDKHSRVALVVCEGAVEPELFERLVGTSVETLRKGGALE